MDLSCSGVILAGGRSSRFDGVNKAFMDLRGRPVIAPVANLLGQMFSRVLIVTHDPLAYLPWDTGIVTDLFSVRSSLTGIHTGLFYAQTSYIFAVACDTPFIRRSVVELVLSEVEPGVDAVMPRTPAGLEPLCAVYASQSLSVVERHLREEKFKIRRVFENLRVKVIPEQKVMAADPALDTFFNINTPADLETARFRMEKS
ncbi:MAG: molybdenum cofactor guanylyltransferase [Desulfobacterales bacterium]|nr:molybdenum cofactor guanylyltransferase [Desulfobacterales bacterium]